MIIDKIVSVALVASICYNRFVLHLAISKIR